MRNQEAGTQLFDMHEGQRGMVVVPDVEGLDWGALVRAEVTPSVPVRFRHHVGRVPRDTMMGGTPELLLISDRFLSVLREHDFSGWKTYPVEVRRKRGDLIHGYSGLAITGRSRPHPNVRAVLARHGAEELVRRTWDGSDVYLEGGSLIIVTGRVRDALRAARVTNVSFTRVG